MDRFRALHWTVPALIAVVLFNLTDCVPTATGAIKINQCKNMIEYRCSNSKCIPLSKVNNSINDCGDNSDEVRHPCRAPMYSCRNDRCVMMEWVLDGNNDCIDMSDEVKLIGSPCHMAVNCCFCHEFVANSECDLEGFCRCSTGYYSNQLGTACIRRLIGGDCRSHAECREAIVHSSCTPFDTDSYGDALVPTPSSGRRCTCNDGFTVSSNGTRCDDYTAPRDVIIIATCVFAIVVLTIVNGFLVVWMFRAFVCRDGGGCCEDSGAEVREFRHPPPAPPSTFRQLFDVWRTKDRPNYRRENWVASDDADRKWNEKRHENGNR